jgi:hypothetical protein
MGDAIRFWVASGCEHTSVLYFYTETTKPLLGAMMGTYVICFLYMFIQYVGVQPSGPVRLLGRLES